MSASTAASIPANPDEYYEAKRPKFTYKQGDIKPFSGFDLADGKLPCKVGSPCLFIHKDSENLRLILEGKHIRMAFKNNDISPLAFPLNYRNMIREERVETIANYRAFFKSELALMLQAFIYTTEGIFNFDDEKWKKFGYENLISEGELDKIFNNGTPPQFYQILKFKCKGGEQVVFESDGNGNFFLEIE